MKLGEVLTIDKDNTIIIEDDAEYTIAGVQSYGKGILNRRRVLGRELTMRKYQIIKPNQLMWCKVDTKNGAFGVTTTEHEGSLASTNMALASINLDKANPKFIQILFQNAFFIDYLNNLSTGTTNRKYIKVSDVLSIVEIPSLSLSEQNEFVERYTRILEQNLLLDEELKTQCSLVKKLKEQVLQDAIQGNLVGQDENDEPASVLLERIKVEKEQLIKEKKIKKEKPLPPILDEEKLFELPKGWEWVRLGILTQLITSGSRGWAKYYSQEGAKFVRMGNLSKKSFELKLDNVQHVKPPLGGEGSRTRLEANDILVSITGDVGLLGLIPEGFGEAYINQHTAVVRLSHYLRGKFYPYTFLSSLCKKQFNSPQRGIKNSFRLTDLEYMLIPLPPLNEQKHIVEKIDRLMSLCDELEMNIEKSKHESEKLMKAVLQEAFTVKEEVIN